MTEDEAKTKWCFHYIASHSDPRQPQSKYGIEQGEPGPFVHHCIGSACMAWRWGDAKREPATVTEIAAHMRENGVGPLDATAATARSVPHGFCGLAGAPA